MNQEQSAATQEWVIRLLEENGPLSCRELSARMYSEQWERWAEEHALELEDVAIYGPLRMMANLAARERGAPVALLPYKLDNHLRRMERAGLIQRIQLLNHRPMLWRVSQSPEN